MKAEYSYDAPKSELPVMIENALAELRDHGHGIDSLDWEWHSGKKSLDFTVLAFGFDVHGEIKISDKITVSARLPFMAMAFSPRIKIRLDDAFKKVSCGKIQKL